MISPINGQHEYEDCEPRPHIEPIFWGTSDMLMWEQDVLIMQLKQKISASRHHELALTSEMLEDAARVMPDGTIDARAVYGYFPVIIEKGNIVVIDPSDFHSELAIFTLLPEKRHIVGSIHPDGDIIALQAVTLGNTLGLNQDQQTEAGINNAVRKTAEALSLLVVEKCTLEITRGMGIPDDGGTQFTCENILDNADESLRLLFEVMSIEERLAMFPGNHGKTHPAYSSFSLFFPRVAQSGS